MKKMNYNRACRIVYILVLLGLLFLIIAKFVASPYGIRFVIGLVLVLLGLLIFVAAITFSIIFCRCPHCGRLFITRASCYCIHCGQYIDRSL